MEFLDRDLEFLAGTGAGEGLDFYDVKDITVNYKCAGSNVLHTHVHTTFDAYTVVYNLDINDTFNCDDRVKYKYLYSIFFLYFRKKFLYELLNITLLKCM